MRSFRDEAVVLRKQDSGEADRLLTLYTRDHGKLKVLAKGVRRPTSRKGGNLDLLTHANLLIRRGPGLGLVTEAKSVNPFFKVKKEIGQISKAYYLCEIVDALCPEEQPSGFVFDLIVSTLANFHSKTNQKIWDFEYQLLRHLGFLDSRSEGRRGLRSYVEEIIERELRTPKFYYSLFGLEGRSR